MAPGVVANDGPPERALERRRRPKKREPRRWLREVEAILLLVVAGFGIVAL